MPPEGHALGWFAGRGALAAVIGWLSAVTPAGADTVVLKNGRTLEGVIESETDDRVILKVGMGAVTLKRASIVSIDRSAETANQSLEEEWETRYIQVRDLPEALQVQARLLARLRVKRETGLAAAQSLPRIQRRIEAREKQLAGQRGEYRQVSRDLAEIPQAKNPRAYNQKVEENNRLVHAMNESAARIEADQASMVRLRDQVAAYSREIGEFELSFEPVHREWAAKPEGGGRIPAAWLTQTRAELDRYQNDFERLVIPVASQQGRSTVVEVSVNGKPPAALILDTGASLVTLSDALARRLGLEVDRGRTMKLQLADGSLVEGYPVELGSVAVGDARVERVPAVVLARSPSNETEGLLGMSFLRHFEVRFDAADSRLVLRRVQVE